MPSGSIDLDLDIYDVKGLSERLDALAYYPVTYNSSNGSLIEPGPLLVQMEKRLRHEIESLRFKVLQSTSAKEEECLVCRRPAISKKVQICWLHFPQRRSLLCHVCGKSSATVSETGYSHCFSCGAKSNGKNVINRIVAYWAELYAKPFGE